MKLNNQVPLSLIQSQVQRALDEDIGSGDITAALIPESQQSAATVISRDTATICGCDWFDQAFWLLDKNISIDWQVSDGDQVDPNQKLCQITGPSRTILSAERTALNFLQTLSGTATTTRTYVDALAGSGITLLDTRKTIPGLRDAQKYAVTCGGGSNHRIGLYDGVLIKENHIAAAGSITQAVTSAKESTPEGIAIEVEVENFDEAQEAINAGADILLLDNMALDTISQIVAFNGKRAKLEISGGVELGSIGRYSDSGVDYISVGSLTKQLSPIDLSMRFS
ncbi:MAG: carboxylating nicotinate-nucleotide diphosphorylase [Gammaproteobacteria bacterium]|nr:carboxylating nicotinate-nucleotide diphosphorylase [Gammaproteobacteria bacterium]